jgi:hypothetical protein
MDWGFVKVLTIVIGGAVLAFCLIMLGTRQVTIHYDRAACHSFATQTERQTKFVTYTYWSWDCLTPTGDGKWISTDNLREFGETP